MWRVAVASPPIPKKTMNETTARQIPAQRGASHVATGDSFGGLVRIPVRFGIHGEIVGYCMIDPRASDWLAAQALGHQKGPEVSVVVHMPSRKIIEMALCFSPASPNTERDRIPGQ